MNAKHLVVGLILSCLLFAGVSWVQAQNESPLLVCQAKDGSLRVITNPDECKKKETILQMYTAESVDAKLATVEERLNALDAENAALTSRVDQLEDVLQHFSREGNEVYITGANLHVVNGLGATASTNALGNIIIGYNETRAPDTDIRTGSHVLVVGSLNNYSSYGGIVIGHNNEMSGDFASVSGGTKNIAENFAAMVVGGFENTAAGPWSVVSGGMGNVASGEQSFVSGGLTNTASGIRSSVTGGHANEARGGESSVNGGNENVATGNGSTVSGGFQRSAPGQDSWAAGSLYESH